MNENTQQFARAVTEAIVSQANSDKLYDSDTVDAIVSHAVKHGLIAFNADGTMRITDDTETLASCEKEPEPLFELYYEHCGNRWNTMWSCTCNDDCPECGREIEPIRYYELDPETGERLTDAESTH